VVYASRLAGQFSQRAYDHAGLISKFSYRSASCRRKAILRPHRIRFLTYKVDTAACMLAMAEETVAPRDNPEPAYGAIDNMNQLASRWLLLMRTDRAGSP